MNEPKVGPKVGDVWVPRNKDYAAREVVGVTGDASVVSTRLLFGTETKAVWPMSKWDDWVFVAAAYLAVPPEEWVKHGPVEVGKYVPLKPEVEYVSTEHQGGYLVVMPHQGPRQDDDYLLLAPDATVADLIAALDDIETDIRVRRLECFRRPEPKSTSAG